MNRAVTTCSETNDWITAAADAMPSRCDIIPVWSPNIAQKRLGQVQNSLHVCLHHKISTKDKLHIFTHTPQSCHDIQACSQGYPYQLLVCKY